MSTYFSRYDDQFESLIAGFKKSYGEQDAIKCENILKDMSRLHGSIINTYCGITNTTKPLDDIKNETLSDLMVYAVNKVPTLNKYKALYLKLHKSNDVNVLKTNFISPSKLDRKKPSLVLFFKDTCGPCKNFLPMWDKLAEKSKNEINMVKYSCIEHEEKCKAIKFIEYYPTILIYKPDDETVELFVDERSENSINEFVKNNTGLSIF